MKNLSKIQELIRSTPLAETLACSESINDAKVVPKAYSKLQDKKCDIQILVDSKYLFTSLAFQRNSIIQSICGEVAMIRFKFQTQNVLKIFWIPGKVYLADALNKKDSCVSKAL